MPSTKRQTDDEFDFIAKGMTTDVLDEYGNKLKPNMKKKKKRHAGRYCLKLMKTIFIHIGLTALLAGYLIAGGYIFNALELSNEADNCYSKQRGYIDKLNSSALRIIGTVRSIEDSVRIQEIVSQIMAGFADDLFVLDFQPSTDCDSIATTVDGSRWSLVNSIYFCVTVITTIGYGHIAPVTFWGRISCIIYAVIGIPLMLIYLAIIGNILAKLFRCIFVNLLCCRCFYDIIRRKYIQRKERLRKWEQELREHEEEEAKRRGLPLPPRKVQSTYDEKDIDEELIKYAYNDDGTTKFYVPLTVSIAVLAGYTMIGAAIFPIWEDWSLADAAYFSFVTISTIGFGDFVPGNGRLSDPKTATELLVGGLYMLLGLALLSMCLNLMKEELIAKFTYIISCFGIKRKQKAKKDNKSDTNDDDDDDDIINNNNHNNSDENNYDEKKNNNNNNNNNTQFNINLKNKESEPNDNDIFMNNNNDEKLNLTNENTFEFENIGFEGDP